MIWSDSYNCLAFQSLIRKYFLWIRILQFTYASSEISINFLKADPVPEAHFFIKFLILKRIFESRVFSDDQIGPSVPSSGKKEV
jgi:hypothetical protein